MIQKTSILIVFRYQLVGGLNSQFKQLIIVQLVKSEVNVSDLINFLKVLKQIYYRRIIFRQNGDSRASRVDKRIKIVKREMDLVFVKT